MLHNNSTRHHGCPLWPQQAQGPLQPHWENEPFPYNQVVEAICQFWHNNQNAKMVIILFGEHSIIGDYTKAIKADDDSMEISFGAMAIRYKYKSPQAWLNNNWESYLIIWFGSPKEVVFHCSPQLPSFLSFASKPLVSLKSGNHPVNYAVKPVGAMRCFIKMFSNPGDTVIDPFVGMHTTSIAALLENRNAIAIETSLSGSVLKIMLKRLSTACWITCPSLQAPAHHTQGGSLLRRKKLLQPSSLLLWPLSSHHNSSPLHKVPLLTPA